MKTPSSSPAAPIAARLVVALNFEGAEAPEWIELIPAGEAVVGRDGRAWTNPNPQAVVHVFAAAAQPLPLDWEHATELRAPKGEDAPAAGWIEELAVRDGGAIWGRVSWTPRGAAQVGAREYRFVSPVFAFGAEDRVIRRLLSAGLTNTPNLHLTALNRADPADEGLHREKKEAPVTTLASRLASALGLAEAATDDDILAAVNTARAANRPTTPDLTSYAPRAELTAAINRAEKVEAELKTLKDGQHADAIDAAIGGALDAGKIIPASEETYRAMCREEGGLERFTALVATLPVIAGAADSRAKNKVETKASSVLTDEDKAVCRAMGLSEADFIAARDAEKKEAA